MPDSTDAPVDESSDRTKALAEAIRRARGTTSQVEVSRLTGRPQSIISNWETGVRAPGLEALAAYETLLGVALGSIAADAGYFTPEAVSGLAGSHVRLLRFATIEEAFRAVEAATQLDLTVRLSHPSGNVSPGDRSPWLVEVGLDPASNRR